MDEKVREEVLEVQAMNVNLLLAGVKERELQQTIIDLARLNGWTVYHTYDSRRSEPGFPDLVLVRERVIYAELKTEKGKLSKHQKKWRYALLAAGADHRIWRPSSWPEIEETLRRSN